MSENAPTEIKLSQKILKNIKKNPEGEVFPLILKDKNISRTIIEAQKHLRKNFTKLFCETLTNWYLQRSSREQFQQNLAHLIKPPSKSVPKKQLSIDDFSLDEIFSSQNTWMNLQNFVNTTILPALEPLFDAEVLDQTIKHNRLSLSFILKQEEKLIQVLTIIRFIQILLTLPETVQNSSHVLKTLQNDLKNLKNKNQSLLKTIENQITAKENAIKKRQQQKQLMDNDKKRDNYVKPIKKKDNIEIIQIELTNLKEKKYKLETPLNKLAERISLFEGLCQHAKNLIAKTDIESVIRDIFSSDKDSEDQNHPYEQVCLQLNNLEEKIKETGLNDTMEQNLKKEYNIKSIQKIFTIVPVLLKEKKISSQQKLSRSTLLYFLAILVITSVPGIALLTNSKQKNSTPQKKSSIYDSDKEDSKNTGEDIDGIETINFSEKKEEIIHNISLLNIAISKNDPWLIKNPIDNLNAIFFNDFKKYTNKNNLRDKTMLKFSSKTFFSLYQLWIKHDELSDKHISIKNNFNRLLYNISNLTLTLSSSIYSIECEEGFKNVYQIKKQDGEKTKTYSISIEPGNKKFNTYLIDVSGWSKLQLRLSKKEGTIDFIFLEEINQKSDPCNRARAMLMMFIIQAINESPHNDKNSIMKIQHCIIDLKFQKNLALATAIARDAYSDPELASFGKQNF